MADEDDGYHPEYDGRRERASSLSMRVRKPLGMMINEASFTDRPEDRRISRYRCQRRLSADMDARMIAQVIINPFDNAKRSIQKEGGSISL